MGKEVLAARWAMEADRLEGSRAVHVVEEVMGTVEMTAAAAGRAMEADRPEGARVGQMEADRPEGARVGAAGRVVKKAARTVELAVAAPMVGAAANAADGLGAALGGGEARRAGPLIWRMGAKTHL